MKKALHLMIKPIYMEEYRKAFNAKYNVKATKPELEYREINLNDVEINELLSIRAFRKATLLALRTYCTLYMTKMADN